MIIKQLQSKSKKVNMLNINTKMRFTHRENKAILKAVLNRIICSNFAKYFSNLHAKESNNHC